MAGWRSLLPAAVAALVTFVGLPGKAEGAGEAPVTSDSVRVVLPTSRREPQTWSYTFDAPPGEWAGPGYDDSGWKRGDAPFGGRGTTRWTTSRIWLRKSVEIPAGELPLNPFLHILHDEDVQVFLNGVLVCDRPGFSGRYVRLRIPGDAFRPGRNVLAVQCTQTRGGQAIDLGILDVREEKLPTLSSTVRVDFSASLGPPLVKDKFGVYNCPYFSMDRWFRDLRLLEELNCRFLRYDPTWGGHNVGIDMNSPQISGTADALRYNWTDFDRFTDSLLARKMEPMYVMAYTPVPLQRTPGVWGDKPTSMEGWRTVCRDYASHWRTTGRKVTHYEIWNEPDNPPFFFRGSMQDYFDIYRHGALGVKEGDPEALVGGPAVAALEHDDSWLVGFLDFVSSESLPLDFLSFHNYGDPVPIIEKARAALRKHPHLAHVPLMLTEYNSFVPLTPDFVEGGGIEDHRAAARLLRDFKRLLEYPDVTRVCWAMFNDPDTPERCGLVSLDGHRKAAFNAFRIYSELPESRVAAEVSGGEVEAMASSDTTCSALLLWNCSERDHQVTASLEGLSFPGRLQCLRIDRSHGSYYDNPRSEILEPVSEEVVRPGNATWTGTVPAGGVVWLRVVPEVDDGRGAGS